MKPRVRCAEAVVLFYRRRRTLRRKFFGVGLPRLARSDPSDRRIRRIRPIKLPLSSRHMLRSDLIEIPQWLGEPHQAAQRFGVALQALDQVIKRLL